MEILKRSKRGFRALFLISGGWGWFCCVKMTRLRFGGPVEIGLMFDLCVLMSLILLDWAFRVFFCFFY